MRKFSHTFHYEIRQVANVIDIGVHNGVSKFVSDYAIQIEALRAADFAIFVTNRQIAVVVHVDFH